LAAEDSVDCGGRQQWVASSTFVVGGGKAIVGRKWMMASSRRLVGGRIIYWKLYVCVGALR
jgi:hypothetical protein